YISQCRGEERQPFFRDESPQISDDGNVVVPTPLRADAGATAGIGAEDPGVDTRRNQSRGDACVSGPGQLRFVNCAAKCNPAIGTAKHTALEPAERRGISFGQVLERSKD